MRGGDGRSAALLAPSDDELTYGLDEWPVGDRAVLTEALVVDDIPYRWEPGVVLVVPAAVEAFVDAVLDELEGSGAARRRRRRGGCGRRGRRGPAAMSDLFLAADRLCNAPWDQNLADELSVVADVVAASLPPYGVGVTEWQRIHALAASVVDATRRRGCRRRRGRGPARPPVRDVLRPLVYEAQHSGAARRHGGVMDAPATELEEVYRELRPGLIRLANLLTGSESLAEDIVQDAFIGYARRADGVDNPHGYLRTSVVNLARTAHRRAGRAQRHRPDVVTVTHQREIDETWAALRVLPQRQRAVLVLRYYEDLPFDDIGRLLGCPATTARSLAHRGLARLKEVLT